MSDQQRSTTRDERVGAVIREHLEAFRKSGPGRRRHPAEVTSDRLGEARERWFEHFTREELDMIAAIRSKLEAIAEGGEED